MRRAEVDAKRAILGENLANVGGLLAGIVIVMWCLSFTFTIVMVCLKATGNAPTWPWFSLFGLSVFVGPIYSLYISIPAIAFIVTGDRMKAKQETIAKIIEEAKELGKKAFKNGNLLDKLKEGWPVKYLEYFEYAEHEHALANAYDDGRRYYRYLRLQDVVRQDALAKYGANVEYEAAFAVGETAEALNDGPLTMKWTDYSEVLRLAGAWDLSHDQLDKLDGALRHIALVPLDLPHPQVGRVWQFLVTGSNRDAKVTANQVAYTMKEGRVVIADPKPGQVDME